MIKKNGLTDAEKIIVTIALWIAAVSVFATGITFYMLPSRVAIFYRPADLMSEEYYSKFFNLLLLCVAVVPEIIIVIAVSLKRRGRMQNNFLSIILFSIMLSLCVDSVIIYGIMWQFAASDSVARANINSIICLLVTFLISIIAGFLPSIINAPGRKYAGVAAEKFCAVAVSDWHIGVYSSLLCAVACVFTPTYYCYITLGVYSAAFIVYLIVRMKKIKI